MKKIIFAIIFIGLVSLLAISFIQNRSNSVNLDSFAQCLAEKKITMYGAAWCAHCQNEKKAFGESFRFVPYVECPDNPNVCLAAGIDGFPTWVFPDGRKFKGEQGLQKLSQTSGCPLPIINN